LAKLVRPTVALVNNAQREHQEFMGTVEAVAHENGAVLQALPSEGIAVFPADEEFTPLWRSLSGQRQQRSFAMVPVAKPNVLADVHAAVVVWQSGAWQFTLKTPEGTAPVRLHIAGRERHREGREGNAALARDPLDQRHLARRFSAQPVIDAGDSDPSRQGHVCKQQQREAVRPARNRQTQRSGAFGLGPQRRQIGGEARSL
jgi:UDP-N-acetylmuramoyl-tripeptide--D-alanyl-D-alanine ligase